MANQQAAGQESLGEAMNRTEFFLEKHGRTMSYLILALFVVAALVFGYRALIVAPRAEKATALIAEAQNRFEQETPDYELALLGDDSGAGFLEVIERYGSTPSGNLAKHYAGICYLRMGDLENAAAYLAKFSPVKGLPGQIINAQNFGLQGDVAVEQQQYAKAVKFFRKAVSVSDNNFTAPVYLYKQALTEQALGNDKQAAGLFERILADYPMSTEAREAEKLLGGVNR
ncbi:MAG: tetratricopeptide repeat protein [Alistipes sp.]|nr:tetratricopeptide repeat protein [Alistipes sp.]